jgi:hypothetical protein
MSSEQTLETVLVVIRLNARASCTQYRVFPAASD